MLQMIMQTVKSERTERSQEKKQLKGLAGVTYGPLAISSDKNRDKEKASTQTFKPLFVVGFIVENLLEELANLQ